MVSCSYRIKSIEYTDSGIKVNFVPNADSLEVEISKDHIEQFFDILRKNKYNTEHLYLNTVLNKCSNSHDALAINVPNENGIGTSPSEWIDCHFNNSDPQNSNEASRSADTIKFGLWKEDDMYWYLSWSKIGELDCGDIYLCDSIVDSRIFDETSNNYSKSDLRQFLKSFYEKAFSPSEKSRMICHPLLKDFTYALSILEFCKYETNIKKIDSTWWLRSPNADTNSAAHICGCGVLADTCCHISDERRGVRPAIILKRSV